MATKEEIIAGVYKDFFGSTQDTLKRARAKDPTITYKDVAQWKERNTMRKGQIPGKQSFVANGPKDEYQMDVFKMKEEDLEDKDVPGLLMVDIFTKQTEVVPLDGLTAPDVLAGMLQCIHRLGGNPKTFYADDDPAWQGAVQQYCDEHNIRLLKTRSHAGVAERNIRTFKDMIFKRLDAPGYEGPKKWSDPGLIAKVLVLYNHGMVHHTTGLTPMNAKKPENHFETKMNLELNRKQERKYPTISVGSKVRIWYKKRYQKERHPHWSNEVYEVKKIEYSMGQPFYTTTSRERPYMRHELLLV